MWRSLGGTRCQHNKTKSLEEWAANKQINVKKAKEYKALGLQRIRNIMILDRYISWLNTQPINNSLLEICKLYRIELICGELKKAYPLNTQLFNIDWYILCAILSPHNWREFSRKHKQNVALYEVLEIESSKLSKIRSQITQLAKEIQA